MQNTNFSFIEEQINRKQEAIFQLREKYYGIQDRKRKYESGLNSGATKEEMKLFRRKILTEQLKFDSLHYDMEYVELEKSVLQCKREFLIGRLSCEDLIESLDELNYYIRKNRLEKEMSEAESKIKIVRAGNPYSSLGIICNKHQQEESLGVIIKINDSLIKWLEKDYESRKESGKRLLLDAGNKSNE